MAFYTIKNIWGGCEVFFENGVFDENGIKEARTILCRKLKERIKERIDLTQTSLVQNERYRDILYDMKNFYETEKIEYKSKNFLDDEIKRLTEKNIRQQNEINVYKNLLESSDEDKILNTYTYEIVQVPIFNHCDEKLLEEVI